MPKLRTLLCDAIFISKLGCLVLQSGVSISESEHKLLVLRVLQDMKDDIRLGGTTKENLGTFRDQIIDELCMLQNRDEKYHCYGVIRKWIIDFLRREQVEFERQT